jgi:PAT family beta-lactamase induction signal transducer AmpG
MGGLIALMAIVAVTAEDTPRPDADVLHKELEEPGALEPRGRAVALAIVGISWAWAIFTIGSFMISMLTTAPGEKQPSVADFTKHYGPWVIVATVIVPLVVSSLINWLRARKRYVLTQPDHRHTPARNALNHLYVALVAPLGELSARLGWGVLIVLGLILTYTLCYNIWSSFAFPFYLDFLHYSKDEVAFASKIFGIFMTMVGIAIGGYLFVRIGRMPTVLIGSLGRGIAGEAFDIYGYATVFRWTAAAGAFAILFVVLEWMRVGAEGRRAEVDTAAEVAKA